MKIEDLLNEYQFENVFQVPSIANANGFKTEYNADEFLFTSPDGEQVKASKEDLESLITPEEILTKSQVDLTEKIAEFLDKDNLDFEQFPERFQINKWSSFGEENPTAFTVIDLENKVAINGGTLMHHAYENGFLLDGKGTKLEDGELSAIIVSKKGNKLKLRRVGKLLKAIMRKDKLEIPSKIIGKEISQKDQARLENGEVVVMKGYKGRDIILQTDKELNQVLLLTDKDIKLPNIIGASNKLHYSGYELNLDEKNQLANGQTLKNIPVASNDLTFFADVKLNQGKSEMVFENLVKIDREQIHNKERDIAIPDKIGGVDISDDIKNAIKSGKSVHLEDLTNAKGEKYNAFLYFDFEKNELKFSREDPFQEKILIKKGISTDVDKEKELRDALNRDDFKKISELKNGGYKPSEEVIKELGKKLSSDKKIAFETIFGIKPEKKEDLKPEKKVGTEKSQEKEQKMEEPLLGKKTKAGITGVGKAFEGM